ncbi:MAG: DotA/TraY family protein [Alphaproteobacteria bacterium]|nr:DotA/TraY family protein [Alphaproteobacteria bacterium]
MQHIKTRDVVAYTTLPRIIPRVKDFLTSGFGCIPFLIAQIYAMVRLLPENHPYLSGANIGRFGIRHVIAEASVNLRFNRKNIDQIVVFFAILSGIVLLFVQFLMLIYALMASHAEAFSWFDTEYPQTDVAFTLMDRVFGVPNIFCNFAGDCTAYSIDTNGPGIGAPKLPTPFHSALHELFHFYSTGLLIVGVLIFLYFMVVIVLETAVSGTPFGQRFQNVWVPVRLVVALGLLMPIPVGATAPYGAMGTTLNSAQYITLYVAKYGSSFATNGWRSFNTAIGQHPMFTGAGPSDIESGNPLGERYTLLALPEAPDISPLVELMSLVHSCAYAYMRKYSRDDGSTYNGYSFSKFDDYRISTDPQTYPVVPYLVKKTTSAMLAANGTAIGGTPIIGDASNRLRVQNTSTPTYMQALGFYYGNDIIIRFGEYKEHVGGSKSGTAIYEDDTGGVKPLCGDVRIPIADLSNVGGAAAGEGGADHMQRFYYDIVLAMWFADNRIREFATNYVSAITDGVADRAGIGANPGVCDDPSAGVGQVGQPTSVALCEGTNAGAPSPAGTPNAEWRTERINYYATALTTAIRIAWRNYVLNYGGNRMTLEVINRGWGGAGIWYTKIAEVNGGFMDSVFNIPNMDSFPLVMERIREEKQKQTKNIDLKDIYNPAILIEGGKDIVDLSLQDMESVGKPLHVVHQYWNQDMKNPTKENNFGLGNTIMHAMHLLLGTSGLAQMRTTNSHLHPMAQLVAVGKGLVESVVRNMALSTGMAFMGGFLGNKTDTKATGGVFSALSQVFLSMAFIGIVAGFILFYILPFLPFVYFYFAVASWVKGIFEAMVGVPLWALAHLRLDGEGLPGDAAQNGYFLLLDIFVRPILTVVGLIAAVVIFSTQVRILNIIWDLVTANASGFTPGQDIIQETYVADLRYQRSVVDQFFFTVIYAVIAYMLALASFKLIDRIPDNILRWAGAGVSAFGDIEQEDIDSLSRHAAFGGMTIGGDLSGAANTTARSAGSGLAEAVGYADKPPPKA